MGTGEIDSRVFDAIGKKGNGLESDTQQEPGNPRSDTWNRDDTVGTLFVQWHRRQQRKSRKG